VTGGVYDLLPNETLTKTVNENLNLVGGYTYAPAEKEFALKIQETFSKRTPLESTYTTEKFGG